MKRPNISSHVTSTDQGITLRPATTADADAIAALTNELGYATDGAAISERLTRQLGRIDQAIIVAETPENGVVGWIQATTSEVLESGFRAEIAGLIVSNRVRRRGVGRLLVAQAEAWARQQSAPAMVVRSNLQRAESHGFYLSLGYAHTKNQAVYRKTFAPSA